MKPLKLTMNAFSTFATNTEIDFTTLGERGIYLITGDTGAGKTTIFDAICFALYGEASGFYRSYGNKSRAKLRSNYVKDKKIKTSVKFEFLCKNKHYIIERTMKNDANFTVEVSLITPTDRLSGVSEVEKCIKEEVIGLDLAQFKQIIMIAQGAFQEVLNTSTKDRDIIFRKIFNTQLYEDLNERLKTKERKLYNSLNEERIKLVSKVEGIYCADDEKLLLEKSKITTDCTITIPELLESLKTFDEKLGLNKKNLEKEKADVITQKNIIIEDLKLAQSIVTTKSSIEKLENVTIPKQKEEEILANDELKKIKSKQKDIDKISEEITNLKNVMPKYEKLENLSIDLENIEKTKAEKDKTQKKLLVDNEIKEKELKDKNEELKTLDNVELDLQKAKQEKEGVTLDLDKFGEVLNNIKTIEENEKKYSTLQDEYKDLAQEETKLLDSYTKMRNILNAQRAGILAQELRNNPDNPCPVCGSVNHPKLASLQDESVTEKTVNDLEKKYNLAKENCEKKNVEMVSIDTQIKTVQKTVDTSLKQYKIKKQTQKEFLVEKIANLKEEQEKKQTIINDLTTKSTQKTTLKTELEDLTKKIEENKTLLEELKKEISEIEVTIQSNKAKQEILTKDLIYKSKIEATKVLEEKEKIKTDYDNEKEKAQKNKEKASDNLAVSSGKLKALKEDLKKRKGKKDFDIGKLTSRKEELEITEKSKQIEIDKITQYLPLNKKLESVIDSLFSNIEDKEKEHKIYSRLYGITSGTYNSDKKITFERYILTAYFNRVIQEANKRFTPLTNGQFTLERQEEKTTSGQMGLGLSVYDSNTGTTNDVTTLSGGESFKAALSMALGLSSIVQQTSGGIELDSLFVDEGFGSLDQESIKSALETLYSMTEGNKTVGIISHIEALQQRIERQIVVEKTEKGSKIRQV